MDENKIINACDVKWENVMISNVFDKYKQRYCYVNYFDPITKTKSPFRVRLNGKLLAKFGVNVKNGDFGDVLSISLSLSEMGADDPESGEAYKFFHEFDEFLVNEAEKRCKDWFNKHSLMREVISEKYIPMVHYSRDPSTKAIAPYPPTIKFALMKKQGTNELDTSIYIRDQETGTSTRVDMDSENCSNIIEKNDSLRPVVDCFKIWFSPSSFGSKWPMHQARLYKHQIQEVSKDIDLTGGDSDDEQKQKAGSPDWDEKEGE